jgi:hypothetical protein
MTDVANYPNMGIDWTGGRVLNGTYSNFEAIDDVRFFLSGRRLSYFSFACCVLLVVSHLAAAVRSPHSHHPQPTPNPTLQVVIFYEFKYLDGPNGVLGQAGPIYTRQDSKVPLSALMSFDSSDYGPGKTYPQDLFAKVVVHEMAHALGYGSVWDNTANGIGCVPNCVAGSNITTYYTCAHAQAQYTAIGCPGQLQVETLMARGSGCVHWKESMMMSELMTPVSGAWARSGGGNSGRVKSAARERWLV